MEMMKIDDFQSQWNLDPKICSNLHKCKIDSFFPVQLSVIPLLLKFNSDINVNPRDLCVSAPTGSGKTIAFVVPILNTLKNRKVSQLRALVMLPSRELASQVYGVFCALSEGLGLKVLLATGQTDLSEERRVLMGDTSPVFPFGNTSSRVTSNQHLYQQIFPQDCHCNIDILVCTPGRLQEHLHSTEGFTLRHLRFLVLDEADRLLGNSYHQWVKDLLYSTQSYHLSYTGTKDQDLQGESSFSHSDQTSILPHSMNSSSSSSIKISNRKLSRPPLQRLLFSATLTENPRKLALLGIRHPILIHSESLQELIEEREKEKEKEKEKKGMEKELDDDKREEKEKDEEVETEDLEDLEINLTALPSTSPSTTTYPMVLPIAPLQPVPNSSLSSISASSTDGFVLPALLSESVRVVETSQKPKALLALLAQYYSPSPSGPSSSSSSQVCMVFCSSVDGAHRLARLMQLFNGQTLSSENDEKNEQNEGDNEEEEEEEKDRTEDQDEIEDEQQVKKRKRIPSASSSPSSSSTASSSHPMTTTSSVSSSLVFGGLVEEMSSTVRNSKERERVMREALEGRVRVLVCTDQMSRGIDLPNITLVVNYDPPKFERVYVHRAGRTARAGREGHCVTLLKVGQVATYKKMRSNISHPKYSTTSSTQMKETSKKSSERKRNSSQDLLPFMNKCKITKEIFEKITPDYNRSLRELRFVLDEEAD